jgi:hypothetical protein
MNRSHDRTRKRFRQRLVAAAILLAIAPAQRVFARSINFPPSDFKILNQDGTRVIGHGHYEITPDKGKLANAVGEDRFARGEYDIERDLLELRDAGQAPRMLTFEHTFYARDGSVERAAKVNFNTGQVSCTRYDNGKADVASATLSLPQDTYAGSMIVLPLRQILVDGNFGPIVLHDFNCLPGPKVLKVKAYVNKPSAWKFHPGQLVQLDIKPDFGWFNVVVAPFIPDIRAWFNPADDWSFAGGEFTRYYQGPQIILTRIAAEKSAKAEAGSASPRVR